MLWAASRNILRETKIYQRSSPNKEVNDDENSWKVFPPSDEVLSCKTFMQYLEPASSNGAKKLNEIAPVNKTFTTRKSRSVISAWKDHTNLFRLLFTDKSTAKLIAIIFPRFHK